MGEEDEHVQDPKAGDGEEDSGWALEAVAALSPRRGKTRTPEAATASSTFGSGLLCVGLG